MGGPRSVQRLPPSQRHLVPRRAGQDDPPADAQAPLRRLQAGESAMSYRDAIADILPRSAWIAPDGERATVRCAAARHVTFLRLSHIVPGPFAQPVETLHEREFRARFSPIYDRQAIRSQFSMSLANLGEFRVFWLPHLRRIVCRSISCTRHFRIPEGSLEVGTFSGPCKMADFFEALDFVVLRALEATAEGKAA